MPNHGSAAFDDLGAGFLDCPTWALSCTRPIVVGVAALCFLVGAITIWSVTIPIASAVTAAGTVVVESSRKMVQHPDGGIVSAILVHDGDHVYAGQPLLRFEKARVESSLKAVRQLLGTTIVQLSRLEAERKEAPEIDFTGLNGLERFEQEAEDQSRLFQARRETLKESLAAFAIEAKQARTLARGLQQQAEQETIRLQFAERQLSTIATLAADGFETRHRVIEQSSVVVELRSEIAGIASRAAEAWQRADRADAEGAKTKAGFLESVETDRQQALRERIELSDKLQILLEQQGRLVSSAPVSGTIVNLSAHTVGGVVLPGATIMEIVPEDDPLVIAAQVRPTDIDNIKIGQTVDVRLDGYVGRFLPRLTGTVVGVSADQLISRADFVPYFEVKVKADGDAIAASGQTLRPGKPVSLMIMTGERTVAEYILQPILGIIFSAMRS